MQILYWAKSNKTGLLIVICVPLLIFSIWLRNDRQKTERWKMADELASTTIFWGVPKANPANNEFVYAQRSKNGLELYWQNAAGNKVLISERKEGDFNPSIFRVHDWSPDGKFFVYTCDGHVLICGTNYGGQVADINVGGGLFNFVWLSSSSIAAFNWNDLFLLHNGQDGWNATKFFTTAKSSSVDMLTRLSDDSVAWWQDNEVWVYDFRHRSSERISDSTTNPVVGFSLSEADVNILMNCGTNGGDLFRCSPDRPKEPWVHLGRIGNPNDFIYKVYELNGGGYAYLASDVRDRDSRPAVENKNFTLFIQKTLQSEPAAILGEREIEDCEMNGDHLYILGTQNNEPPGIWDYDVKSDSLRCLYSALPSAKYSKSASMEYHTTTNALGETVNYYVWQPTHFVAGKKYPLVVTQTTYRWMLEAEVAANSGYYFAMAERPIWSSERINSWGEDVKGVCADLAKGGNIDTNRVFLSSVSLEGSPLATLMEENPEFAKGAFLQGWRGPKTMNGHVADIVMLVGDKDEGNKLDDLKKYQEEAAWNGIAVKIIVRTGPHSTITQDNQSILARQYADFLQQNK